MAIFEVCLAIYLIIGMAFSVVALSNHEPHSFIGWVIHIFGFIFGVIFWMPLVVMSIIASI